MKLWFPGDTERFEPEKDELITQLRALNIASEEELRAIENLSTEELKGIKEGLTALSNQKQLITGLDGDVPLRRIGGIPFIDSNDIPPLRRIEMGLAGATYDDFNIVPQANTELESRKKADPLGDFGPYQNVRRILMAPMEFAGPTLARAYNKIGGVSTIPRMKNFQEQVTIARMLADENVRTMHAIGIDNDPVSQTLELTQAGVKVILVDIAHGGMKRLSDACEQISRHTTDIPGFTLIAGNVATYNQGMQLKNSGVGILRAGVGGGSVCITRKETGVGIPLISSFDDLIRVGIPVIADQNIRNPEDYGKAVGLGASYIMAGSLFARAEEAEGKIYKKWILFGKRFRVYRGQASASYAKDRGKKIDEFRSAEGVERTVEVTGPLEDMIYRYDAGLRSLISYSGFDSARAFQGNAVFSKLASAAAVEEAGAHLKDKNINGTLWSVRKLLAKLIGNHKKNSPEAT